MRMFWNSMTTIFYHYLLLKPHKNPVSSNNVRLGLTVIIEQIIVYGNLIGSVVD